MNKENGEGLDEVVKFKSRNDYKYRWEYGGRSGSWVTQRRKNMVTLGKL